MYAWVSPSDCNCRNGIACARYTGIQILLNEWVITSYLDILGVYGLIETTRLPLNFPAVLQGIEVLYLSRN
jgi:hypothetical protein